MRDDRCCVHTVFPEGNDKVEMAPMTMGYTLGFTFSWEYLLVVFSQAQAQCSLPGPFSFRTHLAKKSFLFTGV